MSHMLGARHPKQSNFMGILLCGCRFKFEVGNVSLRAISMTNSTWLSYFFYLINEERKSPIKGHKVRLQCGKELPTSDALCTLLFHLWLQQLLSSSSLKGHYGMGKPS